MLFISRISIRTRVEELLTSEGLTAWWEGGQITCTQRAGRNLTKQFIPKQTTASGLLVNKQHIYF